MKPVSFYTADSSPALSCASSVLRAHGWTAARAPDGNVSVLLLPIPSPPIESVPSPLLDALPEDVTIVGGQLDSPVFAQRTVLDLLQDDFYLCANAQITAHCALKLAAEQIPETFSELPVLVVGWGRIGKHLAELLRHLNARVTVAARRPSDRGMLETLGFSAVHPNQIEKNSSFPLIFNTVPHPVLPLQENSIVIDLASVRGVDGPNVIWARGLPGKLAPTASGNLIARSVLRHIQNQEE